MKAYTDGSFIVIAEDPAAARQWLVSFYGLELCLIKGLVELTCRVTVNWANVNHLPVVLTVHDDVEIVESTNEPTCSVTAPADVWARHFPAGILMGDLHV